MNPKTTNEDWRRKPRKPAAAVRSCHIHIRLTPAELEAIKTGAEAAGMTATDYIIARCCGKMQ